MPEAESLRYVIDGVGIGSLLTIVFWFLKYLSRRDREQAEASKQRDANTEAISERCHRTSDRQSDAIREMALAQAKQTDVIRELAVAVARTNGGTR